MRRLFYVGFGLLPLWSAIVVLYLGSQQPSTSPEYWSVAPWIVIASIPICGVTSAIAFLTFVVYDRTTGTASRKRAIATASFFTLILLALLIAALIRYRDQLQKKEIQREQELALNFVKNNSVVIQAVGSNPRVSLVSWSVSNGMPTMFDISVSGTQKLYAIVRVNRSSSNPTFILSCLTPLYIGQRDPAKGPCGQ